MWGDWLTKDVQHNSQTLASSSSYAHTPHSHLATPPLSLPSTAPSAFPGRHSCLHLHPHIWPHPPPPPPPSLSSVCVGGSNFRSWGLGRAGLWSLPAPAPGGRHTGDQRTLGGLLCRWQCQDNSCSHKGRRSHTGRLQ